jgi:hypothetical protein
MEGLCDRPVVRSIRVGAANAAKPQSGQSKKSKPARRKVPIYTIEGFNLGGTWLQVKVDGIQCEVVEYRSDHIVFVAPAKAGSERQVVVIVDGRASAPFALP